MSVTIPASVTEIGAEAFCQCTALSSATFANTSGWHFASSGTAVDVSNPATNATNLMCRTAHWGDHNAWGSEGIKRY